MNNEKLNEIIRLMDDGAVVLTVNKRLERTLASGYARKKAETTQAWRTPEILPLAVWLSLVWGSTPEGRLAPQLAPERARTLWGKVVSDDPGIDDRLARSPGVRDESWRAWSLMKEYGLPFPDDIYLNTESRALLRWTKEYGRRLERLGFSDPAGVPVLVEKAIRDGRADLPGHVVLAGFDELTPVQAGVVSALEGSGVEVGYWPGAPGEPGGPGSAVGLSEVPERVMVRACGDPRAEAAWAARWARSVTGPGKRVGVIVPNLSSYRDVIRGEFTAELDPASVLPGAGSKGVFNITLGSPLSDEPLVDSALALLRIGPGRAEARTLMDTLASPYFARGPEERALLGRVDVTVREDNRLYTTLGEVKKRIDRVGGAGANEAARGLSTRVSDWLDALGEAGRRKDRPGVWAEWFTGLLNRTGFARGLELASGEYQAYDTFTGLLEDFSALDDIIGPVDRQTAAQTLAELASTRLHQGESPEAPVQVMGPLEAAGQRFDEMIIVGCHEYAWPAPPAPNPFIPLFLQKKANLPRATHDREAWFARVVLARLLGSTEGRVAVTYPEVLDDREVRVSPLFAAAPAFPPDGPAPTTSRLADAVFASGTLEGYPATEPVPVTADEAGAMRGGVGILRDQSLCPFRAFAARRLGASAVAVPEMGLTAMDRGSIVHRALDLFWRDVRGWEGLKALEKDGTLGMAVERAVAGALRDAPVEPPLAGNYVALEKRRLSRLIEEWLTVELQRPPFTVKTLEGWVDMEFAGLRLRGRIDRVDEVEGAGAVLIDYKTGSRADRNGWLPPRPSEPQMPAYAAAGDYRAVAYGHVKPGGCRFTGVAESGETLPGVRGLADDRWIEKADGTEDWQGVVGLWKDTVTALAGDFLGGAAEIDPSPGPGSGDSPCRNCDVKPLCRIFETGISTDGDDDDRE